MSEGDVAIAALTERIKGEIKKYRLIKALKFDISIKLDCIQSGERFFRPARKETEGVAEVTLRLTDTAERKKIRRDDAIKIGIA